MAFFKLGRKSKTDEEKVEKAAESPKSEAKVDTKTKTEAKAEAQTEVKATKSETSAPAEKPKKVKKAPKAEDPALAAKKDHPMFKLVEESVEPKNLGDIIEGKVITMDKTGVYVDLSPLGTGIIYGREYITARDIIKKINVGDSISAKIVDTNNENGYIELSLKEARQALIWSEAEEAIREKRALDLPVKEANKGGLIIEWQGIQGFLPASQLKSEHYPRVADGDKDKILEELKKLVGQRIEVTIITAIPKEGKLIFSEKNPEQKDKQVMIDRYAVGDTVEGEVTGIVDFGVFVKLEEGLEGLVHISEIDWALVEDPKALFKVRDRVKVKIIDIKEGKVSLSIKALLENPWTEAAKKYKKDMVVSGVVIKFNKHGALASIEEGVAGLVHISEFGSDEKLHEKLELGKTYTFKINLFDAKDQKMALSFVEKAGTAKK